MYIGCSDSLSKEMRTYPLYSTMVQQSDVQSRTCLGTLVVLRFFVSENTYLTNCWRVVLICLLNEYLFKSVQFHVFTYTECTYFEIINLKCFILFS